MTPSLKEARNKKLDRRKALFLLKKCGCNREVIKHCTAVSKESLKLARRLKKKGFKVDLNFIETASLLHDIGRSRTHGIRHGLEGSRILKKYPKYASVCKKHIGAGIDKKEAERLGLPAGNYIPKTIEEKIITHIDNTIEGSKKIPIEKTIKAYNKKLGKKHPATKRIIRLSEYMKKLLES
ncbi:MAG: TIGR00295 family protein [Candidatus Altiarchaeales archaeon]|nr:TIGR00295 family protein [Candidatus Altiarchaeales archaeon]